MRFRKTPMEQTDARQASEHIRLGDIYRKQKRYDTAEIRYQQALKLAPDSAPAHLGLGSIYFNSEALHRCRVTPAEGD